MGNAMCGITMEFVPARAYILLSTQSFMIFVTGTKVEDQIAAIETGVIYGRTISRTANLYSKRRQSKNKRNKS
jgi:hypothetical protein